jgi:hypothetical protein
MKKLLLLLLISVGIDCYGQENIMYPMQTLPIIVPTKPLPPKLYIDTGEQRQYKPLTYDTIPCIMLVCDTMHYSNYAPQLNKQYFDKTGIIMWVTGYIKREIKTELEAVYHDPNYTLPNGGRTAMATYWTTEPQSTYTFLEYLDSNKKPLSKSIIVWQSK